MNANLNKWIWRPKENASAPLILYCFHQAGGSAQAYRLWGEEFSDLAEIRAIQLPGRADRLSETPLRRISELNKFLAETLISSPPDRPFAFFGHSLGGIIAYDLARMLASMNGKLPLAVCIASRSPPNIKSTHAPIFQLADDAFLKAMTDIYGSSPGQEYLNDPEVREMFVPIMKADMELFETYEYVPSPPLELPIFASFGLLDPAVSEEDMQAWSVFTTKIFHLEKFGGDHFFWMKNPSIITKPLNLYLSSLLK